MHFSNPLDIFYDNYITIARPYLKIDKYTHPVALSFKYVASTSLNFGTGARTRRHRRLHILRLPPRPFAIPTFAVARLARRDGSS